jgi:outer membrane protein OmpA-like peptidoglycan-associated protein
MKFFIIAVVGLIHLEGFSQDSFYSEAQKLGGTINSFDEESMPIFSKDSSVLYFSRTYEVKDGVTDQDIWVSTRQENGEYGNCEKLKDINNEFNNSAFSISKDGKSLFLLDAYRGEKDKEKGCAISQLKGEQWSKPKHIYIPTLDINGEFYGFHLNSSENVILISYKGSESRGEEDLYVSVKQNDNWLAPVHLGNVINSAGYEISPFLNESMDTLYFSSNGFGGLGDADIFYSVRMDKSWTNWSIPVNMGDKINSPKFDADFSKSNMQAFWSSTREGENSDIFYSNIVKPTKLIANLSSNDVTVYNGTDGNIDLTISGGTAPYVINWSNGMTSEDLQSIKKGIYSVEVKDALNQNAKLEVEIKEPNLVVSEVEEFKTIEIGSKLILKNIFFDYNKANLTSKSNVELMKIYTVLKENPSLKIEISGYTDSRGNATGNQILSEKRAKAVVDYLIKKGISKDKMTFKGFGSDNAIFTDEMISKEKSEVEKEKLHSQNRRIEFKIISN